MRTLLIFLLSGVLMLAACNGDSEEAVEPEEENEAEAEEQEEQTEEETVEEKDEDMSEFESMVNHFEEAGHSIGSETQKAYDMVGAVDGFGIDVDGTEIEFYLYESGSSDLEEIQENEEYDMEGFTLPAVANGTIVLMGHDDHPEAEAIVETFKSY